MGVEILGANITPVPVKAIEMDSTFLPDVDNKAKKNLGQGLEEPSPVDSSHGANGETKELDDVANSNLPKDAVDEWPAPKQIHSFYFVRFRSYEDSKLKVKIEQADKEIQKKNQARFQITEALKAKRSERANVISQLKPLTAEDKQYRAVMDKKTEEMQPLREKLRDASSAARDKGMGLCSSEEELNDLIKSLNYRINHESISLDEEKKVLREIKQLEATRGKVITNAARRNQIEKDGVQDQFKSIRADMDEVKKEKQAVREKIRHLEEERKTIDSEINSLQAELASVNEKKDSAFETLNELRKMRDEANKCYYQNRSLLNSAKELAAKKDIAALEVLSHSEVEKFMSLWSSNKAFREDYERRILPSLDIRQLSRDGRMKNPDEKFIVRETPQAVELEAMPIKMKAKPAKEDVKPVSGHDLVSTQKTHEEIVKSKVEPRRKAADAEDIGNGYYVENSQKEFAKSYEIDAAKLKEMKREEEIAKAKLALDRKKRLAEKAAAKAEARAQKEAEKKQKEKEKRARKKSGMSVPAASEEQLETQTETKNMEPEEVDDKVDNPAPVKAKEQKENIRHRSLAKSQNQIPKVILKRKKSHMYWSWAAPGAIVGLTVIILGLYFAYGRN